MENSIIEDKSLAFAVRIVNVQKHLVKVYHEYVMSKQLLRSGTSIGASVAEAQHGQSKADFASKMNIALKEARETLYWIQLLFRTQYLTKEQYESLHADISELLRLLISTCKTATQEQR